MTTQVPYICPKCKTPIGVIVEQHGQLWLNSGGWLLAEARKHCHVCGDVVYFKRPKKTMGQMTAERIEVMSGLLMEAVG